MVYADGLKREVNRATRYDIRMMMDVFSFVTDGKWSRSMYALYRMSRIRSIMLVTLLYCTYVVVSSSLTSLTCVP